jgi:glycosyltransferase involved in cell wall biosynthesis
MSNYIPGLVSVVMPTYKRSDKLIRAIQSVLDQTYPQIELLLVNDNEPNDDFTLELKKKVQKFTIDPRFNIIIQEKHVNGAVARNEGIKRATGEYIAFLDDDDWWKKDKIEKQVAVISGLDSDWGGVSCKIERYNGDTLVARLPQYKSGYVYKDVLMLLSDFATGTLLMRHEALDDTGYFDEQLLRHQDLQLVVNFTYKYKLFQINEYLHCCDISDAQNRPNVEKIIKAKKSLYQSVMPVIDTLSKAEKRQMYLLNNAEIGYVQLKNKDYIHGFARLMGLITSPRAFYYEIVKVKNKIHSYKV